MFLSNSTNQKKRAIAYYRHSAEDKQELSIPIQRERTQKLCAEYGVDIIHELIDEGKTGLLAKRPGFQSLINDWIKNQNALRFDYVLVYDVSRWGRYQDRDEAGHYEFICRNNGKEVVYVTQGFPVEDKKHLFNMQTFMERQMASEYSRQLSDKVFYGSLKVSQQGFSAGGSACYGMVRVLLDVEKNPVMILKKGEHKAISNARVTFNPANDRTTQTVKDIFTLFDEGKNIKKIAESLNEKGIPSAQGKKWDKQKILRILINENYIGTRIYNKTWSRLKQKQRANHRDEWVVKPDAFPAIIDKEMFHRVQERICLMLFYKWKKGIYAVNRARQYVQSDLRRFLTVKGFHEDEIIEFLNQFPIIYAVTFSTRKSLQLWCFNIPDELRKYKFVIGIGVSSDNVNPVHKVFAIPTNELGCTDISIFSESDSEYLKYQLEENKVEEKISFITEEFLSV